MLINVAKANGIFLAFFFVLDFFESTSEGNLTYLLLI